MKKNLIGFFVEFSCGLNRLLGIFACVSFFFNILIEVVLFGFVFFYYSDYSWLF